MREEALRMCTMHDDRADARIVFDVLDERV